MIPPQGLTASSSIALPRSLPDPPSLLESLGPGPYAWLLDSAAGDRESHRPGSRAPGTAHGPQRAGRYSYAGDDPYLVLRAFGTAARRVAPFSIASF